MRGKLLPVRQLAYFVPDIRAAALAQNATFASGPFFLIDHVALARSEHRGLAVPHDHSSAYGQWGTIMIEFVQQHNPDRSAFHDMYPQGSGQYGLHHAAMFVNDLDVAIGDAVVRGYPLAQYLVTQAGTAYAFVDARRDYGHMLELYEPSEALTGFYAMVADAAIAWNGSDPVRTLA
jgi:hypothetical protein